MYKINYYQYFSQIFLIFNSIIWARIHKVAFLIYLLHFHYFYFLKYFIHQTLHILYLFELGAYMRLSQFILSKNNKFYALLTNQNIIKIPHQKIKRLQCTEGNHHIYLFKIACYSQILLFNFLILFGHEKFSFLLLFLYFLKA